MNDSASQSTTGSAGKDGDASNESEAKSRSRTGDKSAETAREAPEQKEKPENAAKDDGKSSDSKEAEQGPRKPPLYKKPAFIIVAVLVGIVLVIGGIITWLIVRPYVWTDDAYIDGHVVQLSPQVAARVIALHIDDNQFVHKGDLLVELDRTDYEVALEQAKAQADTARGRLEEARARIVSAEAAIPQAAARVHAAEASLKNAADDLERFRHVDERARSRQQLDRAATAATNAQAQVELAQAQLVSANAEVATAKATIGAAEGELRTAQANQHRAEINLGYCRITAPGDGRITQRTVEPGNYVAPGQALCMIVDPNVWVTANYKETQLTRMKPGQPVTISVDAYPEHKFNGHVDSIQAGSGSRFSVLPAENATGNFVKVVQRIPVKIVFEHDANTNDIALLSPGLSVVPRVKVR